MLSLPLVVEAGTPVYGNDDVERNMVLVEKVAYSKGLSPEAISIMLEFAMSLRMGKTVSSSGGLGNKNIHPPLVLNM